MKPDKSTPSDAPDADKAKSRSVSLLPEVWSKIDPIIREKFGNNRSDYFRRLVEADLAGIAPTNGKTVLVELAKKYHPGLAEELTSLATGPEGERINQPKLLARLLETVVTALRVVETSDRGVVREETPIQAELRRHRLIEGALESVTDHLVAGGLLQKADAIIAAQPAPLTRPPSGRGEAKG